MNILMVGETGHWLLCARKYEEGQVRHGVQFRMVVSRVL